MARVNHSKNGGGGGGTALKIHDANALMNAQYTGPESISSNISQQDISQLLRRNSFEQAEIDKEIRRHQGS